MHPRGSVEVAVALSASHRPNQLPRVCHMTARVAVVAASRAKSLHYNVFPLLDFRRPPSKYMLKKYDVHGVTFVKRQNRVFIISTSPVSNRHVVVAVSWFPSVLFLIGVVSGALTESCWSCFAVSYEEVSFLLATWKCLIQRVCSRPALDS